MLWMVLKALLCLWLLALVDAHYTLPDIIYKGPLMTKKLAKSSGSSIVVKTSVEPLLPHNRAIAFILLAEDKSKRTSNSSFSSVVGYFPFNDQDFVHQFYKQMRILSIFGISIGSLRIRTNGTVLEHLESHYLKRSRKFFRNNLNMIKGSENKREALGNQIFATYPGTRHCQVGKQVHYNGERAPLHDLEKCCVMRNRCDLQSGMMYSGIATPTSADNFRRVSCDCDEEFQRCLHKVSSTDADYMGELVYNILQLQCLQPLCNGSPLRHHTMCADKLFSIVWRTEVTPYTTRKT